MKIAFAFLLLILGPFAGADDSAPVRKLLEDLALKRVADQDALLQQLLDSGDPFIKDFVEAWRLGEVYSYTDAAGETVALQRVSEKFRLLATWEVVEVPAGANLPKLRAAPALRRQLKRVTDTIDLASPKVSVRVDAALKLGQSQNPEYLPDLRARWEKETNGRARLAFEEAILISLLKNGESQEELAQTVARLGELKSVRARDQIIALRDKAKLEGDAALFEVADRAAKILRAHEEFLTHVGSFFRGLSTGSVLLMVAFGLAITFGLMGIINMAHGEFIAIGGYTCYVVQGYFLEWFGPQSAAYQWYYWVSLPVCFVVAAVFGLALEKGFIRFLYKRPLESLLATWGLSMVMQQSFRLIFGSDNKSVSTPDMLLGNYEYAGLAMSYSRIFVICFAGFVCLLTWALLTKTNLGLYIRAVMQNRRMASGLGIPVSRVNSMTFAFGCGLAALAGAALSQIGNVGPMMGQTYIVDSFMVVVAGGVGNLLGAGISAMGIGIFDQFQQPLLGPVMGKVVVLFVIILFLQWKPGGLFPTKSRSMED